MARIADFLDDSHKKVLRVSGGCHSCPRRREGFVPATLKSGDVLFLGEAPGKNEVKEGEGFVGASGQLLRAAAEKYGISNYSLSNTIHCRPPNNRKPKAEEISCCLNQFVLDEIQGYRFIVLAGMVPLQALFPSARGNRFRGNIAWHPDFPGQRFYAIYHPSFILRRKDKEPEFDRQMERLARLSRGEDLEVGFEVIHGGGDRFWGAMEEVLASRMISLDIETNQLESWEPTAHVRSLAFTDDGERVIHTDHEEPHWLGFLERLKGYLTDPSRIVLGHNIGFDLDFLDYELGIDCRVTPQDSATVWYEAGQYKMPSLKELASNELDGYRYLIHDASEKFDPDLDRLYSAEDVAYPLQLFRKGIKKVSPRTRDTLLRVSGPSGYILRKITSNGIYFRRDYWKEKVTEYEEKERQIMLRWKEADPAFIPTVHDSGKGLDTYLFTLKRLPIVKETEKGKPSTDESAIKEWVRMGYDYLEHLLDLRGVRKIRSTYLDGYEKWLKGGDRIHSQFTNTFTDSARSSSRKPNTQNIPRVSEIRDLFGAPPGSLLMESDFSQFEFRIKVCLAKDPTGIEAYSQGLDAHTLTARAFCAGEEPTEEERTWAKVINFSLLYGGDAYKVQQWARDQYGLLWSMERAQEFVDYFFGTYSTFQDYDRSLHQQLVYNRGWSETITGHVHHYRDWDHPDRKRRDHAFRAHLNSHAQGPAAQICFYVMILARNLCLKRDLPVRMVNTVHDSIVTEIPDPKLVRPIKAAIEDAKDQANEWIKDWFIVPLVMDHKVGPSWGSMTKA